MILYELVVWLHILAAATWIGGTLFFAAVVVPAARSAGDAGQGRALLGAIGRRFRPIGWLLVGALIATGAANLHFRGIGWTTLRQAAFWGTDFGRALGYKLGLVAAVLAVSAAHDVWSRRAQPGGSRRLASWSGRLILLLSLVILYFAVALVRGLP
jgi:putative copper resistance protein D